mmetsp:Transcript_24854/g.71868  ORF Transcript_24854/g.71868 Transcript_24854/m.71868 type:complete len:279 (-) Transcript_24854:124-960(-)|eukprot:CAMPEP_0181046788 /NCGR_PEP_ID=MMETSP1070-20121207/14531_1 /TAXON_ID=265543 /ORGANISM="Minutocellus polymorphus, Strain NH13" /LENGTH=278 /DNA_ID=CAMNT_0023125413 /DNA_START=12 /DNA_END=848 /DNA_ORIENTATION=+
MMFAVSLLLLALPLVSHAFVPSKARVGRADETALFASRRDVLNNVAAAASTLLLPIQSASAESQFTPGGTLVDRELGPQVGNPEASASRKFDNSNVLFGQDTYFKFGTASPWIEPGDTSFPKQMPFVLSQQRYDALKKYGERVIRGTKAVEALGDVINSTPVEEFSTKILPPDAPEYYLRPLGLLANNFLASENTGTTNELFLARWYINEIYLGIADARAAKSKEDALKSYDAAKKAVNSFLGMMNRSITAKVGDKFELIGQPPTVAAASATEEAKSE